VIEGVIFDLDGVLIDSEQVWDRAAAVTAQLDRELPLMPGASAAVHRLARRWPLGLASSSNRVVIDLVLKRSGLGRSFAATVSSEEVDRGKPAPDVYLAAAEALGVDRRRTMAIEDSANGIRSADAAGMAVVAVPNREFPPAPGALALAALCVDALDRLRPEALERIARARVGGGGRARPA